MRYIPLLLRYFALLLPFPGSSPFTFAMPSVFFHFSDWRFRPDGGLTRPPPKPSPLTPAMPSYFVIFFDRRFWLVYLTLRLILSHFRNAIGLGIFPEDAFDWTAPWTLPLSLSQCLWTSTFFCLALSACRRPETPFPPLPWPVHPHSRNAIGHSACRRLEPPRPIPSYFGKPPFIFALPFFPTAISILGTVRRRECSYETEQCHSYTSPLNCQYLRNGWSDRAEILGGDWLCRGQKWQ